MNKNIQHILNRIKVYYYLEIKYRKYNEEDFDEVEWPNNPDPKKYFIETLIKLNTFESFNYAVVDLMGFDDIGTYLETIDPDKYISYFVNWSYNNYIKMTLYNWIFKKLTLLEEYWKTHYIVNDEKKII
jgi:hypothetical protein